MKKKSCLSFMLSVLLISCVDSLPNGEDYPGLDCSYMDTATVELIKGCLDIPCDGNDCYLDNYYASIANLFPTNWICDVLSETFWGSWGSEFLWDTEQMTGEYCVDENNQIIRLCLSDTNYNYYFSYPDLMEEVPAYLKSNIAAHNCKHSMTLKFYSHYDERCITWTKVWAPGTELDYLPHEVYEVCEDSNVPLVGQTGGIGELHNVYINNQFEEVRL